MTGVLIERNQLDAGTLGEDWPRTAAWNRSFPQGTSAAVTWISDSSAPELQDSEILWFKPHSTGYFLRAALGSRYSLVAMAGDIRRSSIGFLSTPPSMFCEPSVCVGVCKVILGSMG